MNNNIVKVKANGNYYKFINKISRFKVSISDLKKSQNYFSFKISYMDYKKLKSYLPYYNFEIIQNSGISLIKDIIIRYQYYFLSFLIGFILLLLLSNVIIDVNVIHSSKRIRNLVYNALEEKGIKRFSLKKDYDEIIKIKEDVLNKYKNDLEWIEIEIRGMKYIVRVEQRVVNKEISKPNYCHIIAKKSGVITDIITKKGESLINRNTYVKKGDILISGNITFNNEIKDYICAQGIVKAEVWYTVKVTMPLSYTKKEKTGKKKINFAYDKGLGKVKLFKRDNKNYKSKNYKLFSLFGMNFYYIKEEKLKEVTYHLSDKKAEEKAILLALEKINIKKKDKDKIITQKVLKKTLNDSTISLVMFFAVEEDIGKQEIANRDGEVS